ncbi:MAG: TetR/AcrR family transcriptional regulator [bacterium]
MTEEDSIKINKYDSILKSARKLIGQEGFSNFTMDKLAHNAGVAKGTVYLYFKNKNDVLENVLKSGFQNMFERMAYKVNNKKTPEEKIKTLIYENLLYINENKYFFKTVFLDEMNVVFLKKTSQESYNLRRKKYAEFISEIIKKGIDEGIFKNWLNPLKSGFYLISLIKTNAIYNFKTIEAEFNENLIKSEAIEIYDIFIDGVKN